jgi:hypothetical protein
VQIHSVVEAKAMSIVDSSTTHALDSAYVGGSEDYYTALPQIQTMIREFRGLYPGATCRVRLIGDGQVCAGFSMDIILGFFSERIPIHNVIVKPKAPVGYFTTAQLTSPMCTQTSGIESPYLSAANDLSSD